MDRGQPIVNIKQFSKALEAMRSRGYSDISSKIYPGMRHEIHNESRKEDVWNDIALALETWNRRV